MGNGSIHSGNCFKQFDTKKRQNYNGDQFLVFAEMKKFPAALTTRLPANEYNISQTCLVKFSLSTYFQLHFHQSWSCFKQVYREKTELPTSEIEYVIYAATSTSKIVIKGNLLLSWICCNETYMSCVNKLHFLGKNTYRKYLWSWSELKDINYLSSLFMVFVVCFLAIDQILAVDDF